MYIRQRKGRFTVVIKRKGFETLYKTFSKKSDCLKWGKEVEAQMQLKQFKSMSVANKTTLLDVLNRHLEDKIKTSKEPKKLKARFNTIVKSDVVKKLMSDLTPSDFAAYRDNRLGKGAAGATIVRELSFMSVGINKAIDIYNCWIPENPIKKTIKPKEAPPRNRRLSEQEYLLLMQWCKGAPKFKKPNPFWCYAIDFAVETALRQNEQLLLTWKDIDLTKRVMTIKAENTKTGVERVVPLTPKAIEILKSMPRSIARGGRVFLMSKNNFNRGWSAICRNANIENLHWHDLRREACSRLLEKGLSISEVQHFTGHKTVSLMLKTYAAHNPQIIAKKLNK